MSTYIPERGRIYASKLNRKTLEYLKGLVMQVRQDEGLKCDQGGCATMSEIVEYEFRWPRMCGVYLSKSLEPIGDHCWNFLPDGSILDTTADQFGEGPAIKVVAPNDPEYYRYRMEWDVDYHPGHPDIPEFPEHPEWTGEKDFYHAGRLQRERGKRWWLEPEYQKSRIPTDWQERIARDPSRAWHRWMRKQ